MLPAARQPAQPYLNQGKRMQRDETPSAAGRNAPDLGKLPDLIQAVVAERYGPAIGGMGALVSRHAAAIHNLSTRFTSDREDLPAGYLAAPPARAAYLLYFATTGAATVQHALSLAGLPLRDHVGPLRVLDIGAGPLTASLGVATALGPNAQLEVTGLDGVRHALEDGAEVLRRLRPEAKILLHDGNIREGRFLQRSLRGRYDLILMANVLNEWSLGGKKKVTAGESVAQLLNDHLAENGVVVLVEPATRHGSHTLIDVREHLVPLKRWSILAPCAGAEQCPLAGSRKDWCFTDQPWSRPRHIEAIDRAIRHERATLKFSYLVLRAGSAQPPVRHRYRIIGGPMRDGATYRRYLCGKEGRVAATLNVEEFAIPRELLNAFRGDEVQIAGQIQKVQRGRATEQVLVPEGLFKDSRPRVPFRPPSPQKPRNG